MGKRILLVGVGTGLGALVGQVAAFLGAGNLGLIFGAVAGAVLALLIIGPSRKRPAEPGLQRAEEGHPAHPAPRD